jgi:hypothetical protein
LSTKLADSNISVAGSIVGEGIKTIGCVEGASGVAGERAGTGRRVVRPVSLASRAKTPIAVLKKLIVLPWSAAKPMAALPVPVVLFWSA